MDHVHDDPRRPQLVDETQVTPVVHKSARFARARHEGHENRPRFIAVVAPFQRLANAVRETHAARFIREDGRARGQQGRAIRGEVDVQPDVPADGEQANGVRGRQRFQEGRNRVAKRVDGMAGADRLAVVDQKGDPHRLRARRCRDYPRAAPALEDPKLLRREVGYRTAPHVQYPHVDGVPLLCGRERGGGKARDQGRGKARD